MREDNEIMHFRRILGCKKLFGSKAFAEIEEILNFFRQEKKYFCFSVSRSFCLSPLFLSFCAESFATANVGHSCPRQEQEVKVKLTSREKFVGIIFVVSPVLSYFVVVDFVVVIVVLIVVDFVVVVGLDRKGRRKRRSN